MNAHSRFVSRGLSVVEIVVAAAIIATLVTGAGAAWQVYLKVSGSSAQQAQAALLTEEAAEALQLLRDDTWEDNIGPLTFGTPYHIYWTGTRYATTTTATVINGSYLRTLVFSAVSRDSTTDAIVSSGGTNDANTRRVQISVYSSGNTTLPLLQSEMLIHNVYNN